MPPLKLLRFQIWPQTQKIYQFHLAENTKSAKSIDVEIKLYKHIMIAKRNNVSHLIIFIFQVYVFKKYIQGVYKQGNQGNHGKIRDLYNSGKVMEKSGNFVKMFPNQGTLHFCLLNVAKKLPNRRYQKRKQEEKEMKQNLKREKD